MRTAEEPTYRLLMGHSTVSRGRNGHVWTCPILNTHLTVSRLFPDCFPDPQKTVSPRSEHTRCRCTFPTPLKGGETVGGSCGARLSRAQNGHLSISPSKKNHARRTLHTEPLANCGLGWTEMTAPGLRGLNLRDFHPLDGGTLRPRFC
jgi:hypothetical protein